MVLQDAVSPEQMIRALSPAGFKPVHRYNDSRCVRPKRSQSFTVNPFITMIAKRFHQSNKVNALNGGPFALREDRHCNYYLLFCLYSQIQNSIHMILK